MHWTSFCFAVLCQEVADVHELTVEVVSANMNLDIIQVAHQQLDAENVAKESPAKAVPAEEMPAAVEVGNQSVVTTRYACLTNCNIR